ncbi:uncharacterized protein LOC129168184 isoform X2 [Dunckerocampus dactyliophorus]|nr:uncharacterized protein LOC129168184 isoform X2 [Dunckerocampus dactyliophorus]
MTSHVMYSPPLSTCGPLSTGGTEPPTDNQIQTLIAEKLASFRTRNDNIHGSATTHKECPPIRMEVATTNTQNQEDCPMVEVTKHSSGFMVNNSLLQNENKPVWSNVSSKPERCQVAYTKPNVLPVKVTNTVFESKSEETSLIQMIKDPQYDDISDDDGEILKICCEKSQYEDISDDESPTFGIPSPTEPNMSLLNSDTYRQDGAKVQMIISGEIEEVRQIHQSVSPRKCQLEEQEDNAFYVIPLHILSLKYEPPKEQHDFVMIDKCAMKETRQQGGPAPPLEPLLSPSASCLEIYDSSELYQQVNSMKFADHFEVLEDDIDERKDAFQKEGLLYVDLDSCETEDSCDYSSSSEHNYLTVSKHLLERTVPLCSEDEDSQIGQHIEHKSTTKVEQMQTGVGCKNVAHKANKLTDDLVTNTVHILDSSEDENDVQLTDETTDSLHVQINTRGSVTNLDCDEKEQHGHVIKGKKRFPSGSLDIIDDYFVPHKKHPS